MKGKVFSSSQDLYQDQAKILFDFYKVAAAEVPRTLAGIQQE